MAHCTTNAIAQVLKTDISNLLWEVKISDGSRDEVLSKKLNIGMTLNPDGTPNTVHLQEEVKEQVISINANQRPPIEVNTS